MPERQRRVGAFAKLLANYASDDAIIEAGEAAELLFVRGLAFLSTSDSDGFITDSQLTRFVGAGMRDVKKRAEKLASVGVWERHHGGYFVRSWLKIHPSAEEKGYRLKKDRERKHAQAKQGLQEDSARNPDGIREQGDADSLSCIELSSKGTTEQNRTVQNRAANPPAGFAAEAVRAYVEASPETPAASLQAKVARQARELHDEGHDPARILTAAANAARAGWHDLAVQMQRDATRANPTADRPSTTDQRFRGALDLAEQLDRKAIG